MTCKSSFFQFNISGPGRFNSSICGKNLSIVLSSMRLFQLSMHFTRSKMKIALAFEFEVFFTLCWCHCRVKLPKWNSYACELAFALVLCFLELFALSTSSFLSISSLSCSLTLSLSSSLVLSNSRTFAHLAFSFFAFSLHCIWILMVDNKWRKEKWRMGGTNGRRKIEKMGQKLQYYPCWGLRLGPLINYHFIISSLGQKISLNFAICLKYIFYYFKSYNIILDIS